MVEQGVIEPSTNLGQLALYKRKRTGIVQAKKKDGSKEFCVNYRKLNAATTIEDSYPLPCINESPYHLSGTSYS